jgi:hypothetical protein
MSWEDSISLEELHKRFDEAKEYADNIAKMHELLRWYFLGPLYTGPVKPLSYIPVEVKLEPPKRDRVFDISGPILVPGISPFVDISGT